MDKSISDRLLIAASIALSLCGLAGFIYLFVLNMTIYWLILSPVILAVYQLPAAYLYWLYRRNRAARRMEEDPPPRADDPEAD